MPRVRLQPPAHFGSILERHFHAKRMFKLTVIIYENVNSEEKKNKLELSFC